ncbi:14666_t:CDS:2, partial [Racocetra persica]
FATMPTNKSIANIIARYFELPSIFWSLDSFFSSMICNGSDITKDQIYESFYEELKTVLNDPESPEAYNKARELLSTKKLDIRKVDKMLKVKNVLEEVTNCVPAMKRRQEANITSPATSKKKKAEDT